MALLYYPEVYSKSNEWGVVRQIKPIEEVFSVEELEVIIGGRLDFQQIGGGILVYDSKGYAKNLPMNSRATSISIGQGEGYYVTGRAVHILSPLEVDMNQMYELDSEGEWNE